MPRPEMYTNGMLLSLFIAAVFVGWVAQAWKKRTGAAWWLLTMVVQFFVLVLCVVAAPRAHLYPSSPNWSIVLTLATITLGTFPMLLIVATLPRRYHEDGRPRSEPHF